ncbi:MAG: nucleotidyltransferase family protein [Bacteroidetes bacterium]|nr:nucleotidyltransferase family protein [Bacteroidota bacterium]
MNKPVNNKEQLIILIKKHQTEIKKFGVTKLGIFGSFVRNEPTPASDIDFLIEFDPPKKTFRNFMGLIDFLESLTGRTIELVTPQSLSPYIGPHILKSVEYVTLAA